MNFAMVATFVNFTLIKVERHQLFLAFLMKHCIKNG